MPLRFRLNPFRQEVRAENPQRIRRMKPFCARRETFRFAVLRWITPFWAARMISGAAAFRAAAAAALSPEAIASSTLRTVVRMRERRAVLMSVRRAITRVALRAEDVLAIDVLSGLRAASAAGFQVLKNKGRRRVAAGSAGL